MKKSKLDELKNASVGDIAGYFLSTVIIAASAAYLAMAFFWTGSTTTTLSMIFYAVIPVSLALIMYQSFKVARMLYSSAFHEGKVGKRRNKLVIGLAIAVAALNLGFMTVITSGPKLIHGQAGMYKFILLMVILSFALSMILLTEQTDLSVNAE